MNVIIENSNFIFTTNFSGDPARDEVYHSSERKFNIIIPTKEKADELVDLGLKVKVYDKEGSDPVYHIVARLRLDSKWPPLIYLVRDTGEKVQLTDELMVGELDKINVANVKGSFNVYTKPGKDPSLYVDVLYVYQGMNRDPFRDNF